MANLPRLYAPITIAGVRGATPLTLDGAINLLGTLDAAYGKVERDYFKTLDRYESVKTKAAKARWRGKLDDFRGPFKRIEDARTRLENQIEEYIKALGEEGEEPVPEWQFGLSYEASRRGGHNVDININIRRKDGRAITMNEAREALRERLATGVFPRSYEFAEIEYRSPGSGSARGRKFRDGGYGTETLEDSFDAVINATKFSDWRVGGIEE